MADMKGTLRRLWFDLYPRSGKSTVLDTSGFEHVMVGEYKSPGLVNGMHNWLAFYEKEKTGDIDYYGHTCDVHVSVDAFAVSGIDEISLHSYRYVV